MSSASRLCLPHRVSWAPRIVFGAWAVFFLAAVAFVLCFASDIPFMDDLDVFAAMNRPGGISAEWLWRGHVGHRIPLPRLLYVGLLGLTGDIRSILLLNVSLLGAVGLAMIFAARKIRGRASLADVFFAAVWLHWGNELNLLFPFSFTFVLPTALSCTILLVLVTRPQLPSLRSALVIGLCALALPLCGGPGVTQAPAIALWLLVAGWAHRNAEPGTVRVAARPLSVGGVATALLVAVYFLGFSNRLPLADPWAAINTAVKFFSLSVGSSAESLWPWSGLFASSVLVIGAVAILRGVRSPSPGRWRALGLLAYLLAQGCMALAVGLRGTAWSAGFALRYVTLPAPALCAAYFAWLLYVPRKSGTWLCSLTAAGLLAVLPLNVERGLPGARDRVRKLDAFATDARAGLPLEELANRYWRTLYPDEEILLRRLEMLRDAGITPFDRR